MMDRRRFIGGIASGLAAASRLAHGKTAPAKKEVRRIGALLADAPPGNGADGEWTGMKELGWIEGENLVIERRWAHNKPELLPQLADELVRLKVEVIATFGTAATLATKNATSSIPIVMAVGDPIAIGVVSNLARPGGNITGYSQLGSEVTAKRVALLHEMLPAVQRVGILRNPAGAGSAVWRRAKEQAYRAAGLQSFEVEVRDANALEAAVTEVARRGGQALDISVDDMFFENSATILSAALRNRLPTVVPEPEMVEAGGLMAYEALDESYERMVALIDKILRGAKPGDLPIEQPTRFELLINLKTAKALGLAIPQALLLRADRVIQ